MSRLRLPSHEYELLPRSSSESHDLHGLHDLEPTPSNASWADRISAVLPLSKHISNRAACAHYITPRRKKRSLIRLVYWSVFSVPYAALFLVLFVGLFLPSYTHRPAHYDELRQLSLRSAAPGRANPRNETVFIAASLYERNGELTNGAWADEVLELIDLLGPSNVYLSLYENNADELTRKALLALKNKTPCNATVRFEDLDLSALPRVALPNGDTHIKRIAFLAEVRNRALAPIDTTGVAYDRILYINDVNFNPIEAAQLLFSTNVDASGRANYGAACAVDFINPFKFYDRFATRDLDGYNMGIPFFPWFTSAGSSTSRSHVIANSDAVPVRSCWGGMTAFEAKWFQDQQLLSQAAARPPPTTPQLPPLRFRYEQESFWDSSECCLINADLQYRRTGQGMPADSGIYMNPYIRVAYDTATLSWLSLSRRPERLYSLIHDILNHWVGFPQGNPRQTEEPGQVYKDKVWWYDDPVAAFGGKANSSIAQPGSTKPVSTDPAAGHWKTVDRTANPGGFCGGRNLLVINEHPKEGESKWGKIVPPRPKDDGR